MMSSGIVILVCSVFALVPVGICYFARWLLDRARTEPPWIFPLMMVLGGAGGLWFALVVGPQLDDLLPLSGHGSTLGSRLASLSQPALEEPVSYTHLTLPTICSV